MLFERGEIITIQKNKYMCLFYEILDIENHKYIFLNITKNFKLFNQLTNLSFQQNINFLSFKICKELQIHYFSIQHIKLFQYCLDNKIFLITKKKEINFNTFELKPIILSHIHTTKNLYFYNYLLLESIDHLMIHWHSKLMLDNLKHFLIYFLKNIINIIKNFIQSKICISFNLSGIYFNFYNIYIIDYMNIEYENNMIYIGDYEENLIQFYIKLFGLICKEIFNITHIEQLNTLFQITNNYIDKIPNNIDKLYSLLSHLFNIQKCESFNISTLSNSFNSIT